jgi:GR25 family glycosyltransferase involved in LPS biosynthesis
MILDGFPKVLWINLDRSIRRRVRMEKLLNDHKIINYRIKAIDCANATELYGICVMNKNLNLPENACTCSHLKAIKYFVENISDNEIIIFEDDISFEFLKFIPYNWSEFISNLPSEYEIIQLAITHENGHIDNTLIKINPLKKYYCSAAYLITKQAAINILNHYYSPVLNKYDLSIQQYATADSIISNTNATYSIPIFTYLTNDSTIHPKHIYIHNRSKKQQYQLWKHTKDNINIFNKKDYFNSFPKN